MIPIRFSVESYRGRSRPLTAQCFVNCYAEQAPRDDKSPVIILGRPGLSTFAEVGDGPIRGMHVFNGLLYVVSGDTLYSIDANAVTQSHGTIAGQDAVKMADNGLEMVLTGGEIGYGFNGLTLTQIADPDFEGAIDVAYLDGYFVFVKPRSGQFFISSLFDGENYDALDFATAEARPDNVSSIIVDHRLIWLLGDDTIEIWYNSGNADFPFERITGAVIERGSPAPASPARLDNSVFWLGSGPKDEGGYVVYRNSAFKPTRVSTHAIEHQIDGYPADAIAQAVGMSFTVEGHSFYALTFPDQATWVYDATTRLWAEWDSRTAKNAWINQWRGWRNAFVYNKHLIGDFESGKIYTMDLDVGTDDGETIRRVMTSTVIHNNGDRATMNKFKLDIRRGVGLSSGQGSDPQAMLTWSDSGGEQWSNELWRSYGKIGEYNIEVDWNRLGQFHERILAVAISDPAPVSVFGGFAEIVLDG